MAEPSVSVVIPAFCAEGTIQRAVDSVLAQTVPVHEVIVVDDGSPDALSAIVQRYGPPVILIRQVNQGAAAARNTGVERSTGAFVAFLDADDYWEPRKLEHQLAAFAAHPEVGTVASSYYYQRPQGARELSRSGPPDLYDRVRHERGAKAFLLGTMLWTGTVLVRREVLGHEKRFVTGLEPAEDRDLWVRLAARHPVYLLSQPLATAVLEPRGISRGNIADDCTKMLKVVQRHRQLLGWPAYFSWRAYVLYRWAAMERAPLVALSKLGQSFLNWPIPLTCIPAMQSWGRLRRFVMLLRQLVHARQRPRAMRATP